MGKVGTLAPVQGICCMNWLN